ncbi:glycosyltransferase family protein [Pontibacter sp. CAU 1760]
MGLKDSIVLISSGQPSANPRLVKEAIALSEAGYKVTVIYVPISPWADKFDAELIRRLTSIIFVRTGYHPYTEKRLYLWARARRKFLSKIYTWIGDICHIADYSTVLFAQELFQEAKRHRADLYIAHNLGALSVAVKVAQKFKAKVGFDAEDFHRGEFAEESLGNLHTKYLENKYFPKLDYFSVASPLIGEIYQKLFPQLKPLILNNAFSVYLIKNPPEKQTLTLKLFWFSQTIGKNRGIENVILAMGKLAGNSVSFTMLGNITAEMKNYLLSIASRASLHKDQIIFYPAVAEQDIFEIASKCDVGIGSEVPHCLNREYCLTNKIFTYLLAGNALVLSNTLAQKRFLKDFPSLGFTYKSEDSNSLANILRQYIENPNLLALHQKNARKLALEKLNWETESKKFLNTVKEVLAK